MRREMERGGEQEIVGRDGLLQMTIVGYKRNVKISLKDACFPFFLWSTLDRGRDGEMLAVSEKTLSSN